MRSRLLLFFSLLLISSEALATPMHLWSRHFGNYSIDAPNDIAGNPAGEFVISGEVITAVDLGGGFLYPVAGSSLFIAKYDSDCHHQWSKLFDEAVDTEIALDPQGNTVAVGTCFGTVDFGGGPLTTGGTFAAKFNSTGGHIWSRRYPIGAVGVAVDQLGNTFITGNLGGSYSFGGPTLTSAGSTDVFIVKYDPSGAHVWSRRYGSASGETGRRIALDGAGNILVTGSCNGAVDFGGGPLTGPVGVYLLKVDANGTHVWSRRFGGPNNDEIEGVAADASGNVLITGWFSGTAVYGGAPLTPVGGNDAFLAKFAPDGTHQWSKSMGGPGDLDRAFGVAIDPSGNAIVTGEFKPGANFGGGVLPNAGGDDVFVARYDASGAHLSSVGFGSTDWDEWGEAVVVDGSGNYIVNGVFANAVDFGGGSIQSYGWQDVFVAKYGELPVPVLISNFSATARRSAVDVAWDLASDEALNAFTLYRTTDGDTRSVVVASGNASARSHTDDSVEPGKSYDYELTVTIANGDVFRSPVASVDVPALASSLEQNQPNPFNPSTTIAYTLTERATTAVAIYDAAGSLVARLDAGEHDAGTHSVSWNGRDASGRSVASGVYFYQLEGVPGLAARKMVLLK